MSEMALHVLYIKIFAIHKKSLFIPNSSICAVEMLSQILKKQNSILWQAMLI